MQAAVAFRNDPDTRSATAAAAREAREGLVAGAADLALVFHTGEHDAEQVRAALRDELGSDLRIAGGHAVGAMTGRDFGYGGHELAVAVLAGAGAALFVREPLAGDEYPIGAALGRDLGAAGAGDRPLLLLYDSILRTPAGMQLNMAAPLLAGLAATAGQCTDLVGAGLAADMRGSPTWQIADDRVLQQAAIAVAFGAHLRMDQVVLHGCEPASDYKIVTRVDGPTILELDHRPAVEVIGELLGHALPPNRFGFFVTLGVNLGDPWASYDEDAYVNRLCLKADRRRGGLVLFESDIREGTAVQLMHRSIELDHIGPRIEALFAALDGRRPVFALYIDCAGRAAGYAGMEREDAALLQQVVAGRVPLLGFYSGVEIGRILGRPRPLDWTGVFCLFSEVQS